MKKWKCVHCDEEVTGRRAMVKHLDAHLQEQPETTETKNICNQMMSVLEETRRTVR